MELRDYLVFTPNILRKNADGYLQGRIRVTGAGVFTYIGENGKEIKRLRPVDEVCKVESYSTLNGKPLTLQHPNEFCTPENAKELSVGSCMSDAESDGLNIYLSVCVTDLRAIESIEAGKVAAVSCGYSAELIPQSGNWQGVSYDEIMTNIRYNHLALVKKGRAGEDLIFYKSGNIAEWKSMDGEFKLKQNAVNDPTASGLSTSFISKISQDTNGVITAVKRSVPTATSTLKGLVLLGASGGAAKFDDVATSLDTKANQTDLNAHISDTSNPHKVTKAQVGLGNVDNTSDLNKPVSTATQTALNKKLNKTSFKKYNQTFNTSYTTEYKYFKVGTITLDYTEDTSQNQQYVKWNGQVLVNATLDNNYYSSLIEISLLRSYTNGLYHTIVMNNVCIDGSASFYYERRLEGKIAYFDLYMKSYYSSGSLCATLLNENGLNSASKVKATFTGYEGNLISDNNGNTAALVLIPSKSLVNSERTIAGIDLADNITEAELRGALLEATTTSKGLMSAEDKAKIHTHSNKDVLDGITADKVSSWDSKQEAGDYATNTDLSAHLSDTSNPHGVTKAQVGLGNVDNTSDLNKPISTATQNALDLKADKTSLPTYNYDEANQRLIFNNFTKVV